ncbi:MAG TPA: alternative ribosome rescue aminoacyl-tRNA hydrolase ArfB [Gemmatimonadaceae bacterium]|nr:alternative ribosome rescue aminoacyl-tRNA hydrolase ArfB [Gemmatimonadaceae bacterium]
MTDDALPVTDLVRIPRAELEARATRSGGPGGQHVNTSSTRIELLWNIAASGALSDEEKARLRERLGSRIDGEGVLRVVASESRSQRQNREAAEARLAELVRRALHVRRKRVPTKPSRAAKQARLDDKRRRSETKRRRRDGWEE